MNLEQFQHLAQSYTVIPLVQTMLADMLTPVALYSRVRANSAYSFLFESVEGNEKIGRYSFIGIRPHLVIRSSNGKAEIDYLNGNIITKPDFFEALQELSHHYTSPEQTGLTLPRFTGGFVGYIGYDVVRSLESLPKHFPAGEASNDAELGLFSVILAFDHVTQQLHLIKNVLIDQTLPFHFQYSEAMKELSELQEFIANPSLPIEKKTFKANLAGMEANMTKNEFESGVSKAKKYISAGDAFQVVLSQRFSIHYEGDTFQLYRALRVVNPSPYLYFLDFGTSTIIGSSPEILVRTEKNIAEVYPIAGTRKRGASEEDDKRIEEELLSDEKERAEHIMLVDLGRNDLGRVCEKNSVQVERLMFLVRYSHVMHIASRVVGKISTGKSAIDVFKATFPAGTVSGAPKVRAMEIIDELERTKRGMYAGAVGYVGFSGEMDMCIAIRTIFATKDTLYLQAGAGIVADSIPELEFFETVNKAKAMVSAIELANRI